MTTSEMTRGNRTITDPGRGVVPGLPVRNRCLVMGVVNVTPDSFSDGGQYLDGARAIEHGLAMVAEGADIIDVGGESTRPSAGRVSLDEELKRVLPVVRELVASGAVVSIDTTRSEVASAALDAGVHAVNDVSGGLADAAMPGLVATAQVPYIAMHWRAHSLDMQKFAHYHDVVTDVVDELSQRLQALVESGIAAERIVLDPGLGFAKNAAHNWQLLANIASLRSLRCPVLIGASRKSFLGELLKTDLGTPSPHERDSATAAVSALAAAAGAYCVRVHEVKPTVAAVRVAAAWLAASRNPNEMVGNPSAPATPDQQSNPTTTSPIRAN